MSNVTCAFLETSFKLLQNSSLKTSRHTGETVIHRLTQHLGRFITEAKKSVRDCSNKHINSLKGKMPVKEIYNPTYSNLQDGYFKGCKTRVAEQQKL